MEFEDRVRMYSTPIEGLIAGMLKVGFSEAEARDALATVLGPGVDIKVDGYTYNMRPMENSVSLVEDGRRVRISGCISVIPNADGAMDVAIDAAGVTACLDPAWVASASFEDVAEAMAKLGADIEPGMETHVGRYVKVQCQQNALRWGEAVRAD